MITIPEKHFLGQIEHNEIPLGFLSPYGTDKAALKRKATIDRWSNGNVINIVDNELQSGFKILNEERRWRTDNVVWRILDPRGFQLEISSGNLSTIIGHSNIANGIIDCKCIWGRLGNANILLTENSEPYLDGLEANKRISTKISIRDVKIGNKILLHNGTIGTYFGPFTIIGSESVYSYNNVDLSHVSNRYFLKTANGIAASSSLKISKILDDTSMTREEAFSIVKEKYNHRGIFKVILSVNKKHVSIVPEVITKQQMLDDFNDIFARCYTNVIESQYLSYYKVSNSYSTYILCRHGKSHDRFMIKRCTLHDNILTTDFTSRDECTSLNNVQHFVRLNIKIKGETYKAMDLLDVN